jgi:predicted aconitase
VTEEPPRIEPHEAADRFGKAALQSTHRLTEALAEDQDDTPEPVVVRRGGPHRSLDELATLLDEALDQEDRREP